MKPRHELKHAINYSDYLTIRARLGQVMQRDAFAAADGEYRIRSLYFDNYPVSYTHLDVYKRQP